MNRIIMEDGRMGHIEKFNENGTITIRIDKGQEGSGQLISMSKDEIHFVEDDEDVDNTEDNYDGRRLFYGENNNNNINNNISKNNNMKNIAIYAFIGLVIMLGLYAGSTKFSKEKTRIEILTEQLNNLNTEDIQDIESCKRMRNREVLKKQKIKELESFK